MTKKRISGEITQAVREAVWRRAGGLCEFCHTKGDWRGLSYSHNPPKGMGGTRKIYTEDEIELACYKCHAEERHGLKGG